MVDGKQEKFELERIAADAQRAIKANANQKVIGGGFNDSVIINRGNINIVTVANARTEELPKEQVVVIPPKDASTDLVSESSQGDDSLKMLVEDLKDDSKIENSKQQNLSIENRKLLGGGIQDKTPAATGTKAVEAAQAIYKYEVKIEPFDSLTIKQTMEDILAKSRKHIENNKYDGLAELLEDVSRKCIDLASFYKSAETCYINFEKLEDGRDIARVKLPETYEVYELEISEGNDIDGLLESLERGTPRKHYKKLELKEIYKPGGIQVPLAQDSVDPIQPVAHETKIKAVMRILGLDGAKWYSITPRGGKDKVSRKIWDILESSKGIDYKETLAELLSDLGDDVVNRDVAFDIGIKKVKGYDLVYVKKFERGSVTGLTYTKEMSYQIFQLLDAKDVKPREQVDGGANGKAYIALSLKQIQAIEENDI
jgi:hypothetical protein